MQAMALGMDQPPASTVGYDRQTGHAWNMPGPGGETPGPNSGVCEHTHTHTLTHTSAQKHNIHPGNRERHGMGNQADRPEQQDDAHAALCTLRFREDTRSGRPRHAKGCM